MEEKPKTILLNNDAEETEEAGQTFVELPQLSDRCGGSRDESFVIAVPEGITLPDSVRVLQPEDAD